SLHSSIYLHSIMNKTINTIDNNSETILNTDFLNKLLNNESYEPDIETVEFDFECNNESIAEVMIFPSWTVVNRSIKAFAYHDSFSIQKYRSEKLDRKFKIYIHYQKNSHNLKVYSFDSNHENHTLDPEGHLGATNQYRLLKALYPYHTLYKKDLYNTIQQFCNDNDPNLDDTAKLLKHLLN
ncbi:11326_t:CDS:2, partial [Cetraspora pellucida]